MTSPSAHPPIVFRSRASVAARGAALEHIGRASMAVSRVVDADSFEARRRALDALRQAAHAVADMSPQLRPPRPATPPLVDSPRPPQDAS